MAKAVILKSLSFLLLMVEWIACVFGNNVLCPMDKFNKNGICTKCSVVYPPPRLGFQFNPNCGHSPEGGRIMVPFLPCPTGTYNLGQGQPFCVPCSTCSDDKILMACTSSKDTECCRNGEVRNELGVCELICCACNPVSEKRTDDINHYCVLKRAGPFHCNYHAGCQRYEMTTKVELESPPSTIISQLPHNEKHKEHYIVGAALVFCGILVFMALTYFWCRRKRQSGIFSSSLRKCEENETVLETDEKHS